MRQDFFDTTIMVFTWANPTFGICLDAESAVILFLVSFFLAHYFLMWKYKLCKRKNRRALQNYPPSDSEGGLSKVSKIVEEYCYYHHWHLGLIHFSENSRFSDTTKQLVRTDYCSYLSVKPQKFLPSFCVDIAVHSGKLLSVHKEIRSHVVYNL